MKASIVFATGLILAAGAVAGFSNAAHAGAAGAAGSISAQFTTGNTLSATAGAVATGKTGAFTTATGSAPAGGVADITAVATGYAGTLAITNLNTTNSYTIGDEALVTAVQGNNFAATLKTSVNLVPGPGTGVKLN